MVNLQNWWSLVDNVGTMVITRTPFRISFFGGGTMERWEEAIWEW